MLSRATTSVLVSLALATAIHLDWHAARPTAHHLSLGLSWHWLLAIPIFALVAEYVARAWPTSIQRASMAVLGSAIMVAGVVEPAWEYFVDGATLEWTFGRSRVITLATFVGTGLVAYVATLILARRGSGPQIAGD